MSEREEQQPDLSVALAVARLSRGQVPQAIHTLKEVLGEDPENARAHAVLALCLVASRRLAAAEVEARLAVQHDPEEALPHLAMAQVALARRRFDEAREALTLARELDPGDAEIHCELARLYGLWGKPDLAERELAEALELEPDDPSVLSAAAGYELSRGHLARAREHARAALAADPQCYDALVTMGRLELFDGNTESAREHAVFAMRQDPAGEGALELFAALKARQSLALGAWWRFSVWMHSRGTDSSVRLLLAAFVGYRLASVLLRHAGHNGAASAVECAWVALCVYTWVAPSRFQRMVARELESVRLQPEY